MTPQTGSGVAHFSVSEVVQFSMSVDSLQRRADATGALAVLHTWLEAALELGASVGDPPRQEPFGAEAWLLDPEGNRLLLLVLAAQ